MLRCSCACYPVRYECYPVTYRYVFLVDVLGCLDRAIVLTGRVGRAGLGRRLRATR